MLDTLVKIGQWLTKEETSGLDRFLDTPKFNDKDRKGNRIKNYILPIIFDLDKMEIEISPANLKSYDPEKTVPKLTAVKIRGGNNKAIYCTVPVDKIAQIYKTFFGKENTESPSGELIEVFDKDYQDMRESDLHKLLEKIFPLKEQFLELIFDREKNKISNTKIVKLLKLPANEKIILVYVSVKSEEFGFSSPKAIGEMDEYRLFLKREFSSKQQTSKKLCYATGEEVDDVGNLDLKDRYSLNKMFVTETKNYASYFEKKSFEKNYQVSLSSQAKMDRASSYLLKHYKVKIADIDHVIVPQFLSSENLEYDLILEGLKKKSDLLFNLAELEKLAENIEDEMIDNPFWINFFTFESDGNFFKITAMIKDVSHFHFKKVIDTFTIVDREWRDKYSDFVNWESVMAYYGKTGYFFNLNSIYGLIPVRKDKEKKNVALALFKIILENRKVDILQLYKHFSELILCHFYERYKSYSNVNKSQREYFRKAVQNSVFKYLAFFQVLRRLDMIDMENEEQSTELAEQAESDEREQKVQEFFQEMEFSQDQKAMFYLGKMLSYVEYLQKGKNQTIINSVQFDGMDLDKIIRLRISLMEKAKQYGKQRSLKFDDARFGKYFIYNHWLENPLDPKEALFFILTGYSFGTKNKPVKESPKSETE